MIKLGTKYSIPKPGSRGRYEGELLLREDQLLTGIWRQKSVKVGGCVCVSYILRYLPGSTEPLNSI